MSLQFQVSSSKRLSHTYTRIHFPPNVPPIQAATNIEQFRVLYSRSLLVIYFKYRSVYVSIPNSLTIPLPPVPPHNHTKTLLTSREKYTFHSPSQLNQSSFSPIHVQSIKTIIKIRRSVMVLFHYQGGQFRNKTCISYHLSKFIFKIYRDAVQLLKFGVAKAINNCRVINSRIQVQYFFFPIEKSNKKFKNINKLCPYFLQAKLFSSR